MAILLPFVYLWQLCNIFIKGIGGSRQTKIFLFIFTYVIALSFFFTKWGHKFLNYQNFSFYERVNGGHNNKYRKYDSF